MPFQPAMEEPSKAWPFSNLSSSKAETGTVTCCSLPRVSVKRKSTNLASFSLTIFITSCGVAISVSLLRKHVAGPTGDNQKIATSRLEQKLCHRSISNLSILPQRDAARQPTFDAPLLCDH